MHAPAQHGQCKVIVTIKGRHPLMIFCQGGTETNFRNTNNWKVSSGTHLVGKVVKQVPQIRIRKPRFYQIQSVLAVFSQPGNYITLFIHFTRAHYDAGFQLLGELMN